MAAPPAAEAPRAAPAEPPALSELLNGNDAWMDAADVALAAALVAAGQAHVYAGWPPPGAGGAGADGPRRLVAQLRHLDAHYAGGLPAYVAAARRLLADSRAGANPFAGCVPSVPADGERLDFGSPAFREFERLGAAAARDAAFVLVAGGLGERLGYSGIKLALPAERASGAPFLQVFVESVLALQDGSGGGGGGAGGGDGGGGQPARPRRRLPLVIMTSDDTHARTAALLEAHAHFGAAPGQVRLLKQEKVACLADGDGRLALAPGDRFAVLTKPHGHGDVHALLHSSGAAAEWLAAGLRWVCFFQDTNGLVFRGLPAALGVSAARGLAANSLCVPRRGGEAIGGIARLDPGPGGGPPATLNVEYNQLGPLLAALPPGHALARLRGDADDPATGLSPFPGNINQLVFALGPYVEALRATAGVVGEFVNPKYAGADRAAFKSPTRLECMMQDFPRCLPAGAAVGFTVINQVWAAYSPVKNGAPDAAAKAAAGAPSHSAAAAELDTYRCNCEMLAALGARVAPPQAAPPLAGVAGLRLWPRVAWSPRWAATWDALEARLRQGGGGGGARAGARPPAIGAGAALVVVGAPDVGLAGLDLAPGAALVVAPPGAAAPGAGAPGAADAPLPLGRVANAGWAWRPLAPGEPAAEEDAMAGFVVERRATAVARAPEA